MQRRGRLAPFTEDFLREPGHSVRNALQESQKRFYFRFLMLVIGMATWTLKIRWNAGDVPIDVGVLIGWALVFGFLAYRSLHKIVSLRLGWEGELATGQELNLLLRDGCYVFHDLWMDRKRGNIDHVVVGPGGVFSVETKARSKPANRGVDKALVRFDGSHLVYPDGRKEQRPVTQAQGQARWLAEWLSGAVGQSVSVTPVIAMPGWFVEVKGSHPVRVINPKRGNALRPWLQQQQLKADLVERIAWQLEQRVRDVQPWSAKLNPRNQAGGA